MRLKNFVKRLFCKHNYTKVGVADYHEYDESKSSRVFVKLFPIWQCNKCKRFK